MRNKLTFPSGGTETKYVWDKYNLIKDLAHVWDQYKLGYVTQYNWTRYPLVTESATKARTETAQMYAVSQYSTDYNMIQYFKGCIRAYPSELRTDEFYYEPIIPNAFAWKKYPLNKDKTGKSNKLFYTYAFDVEDNTTYPIDGIQGDYWYEYMGIANTKNLYEGYEVQATLKKYHYSPKIKRTTSVKAYQFKNATSSSVKYLWLNSKDITINNDTNGWGSYKNLDFYFLNDEDITFYLAEPDGTISKKSALVADILQACSLSNEEVLIQTGANTRVVGINYNNLLLVNFVMNCDVANNMIHVYGNMGENYSAICSLNGATPVYPTKWDFSISNDVANVKSLIFPWLTEIPSILKTTSTTLDTQLIFAALWEDGRFTWLNDVEEFSGSTYSISEVEYEWGAGDDLISSEEIIVSNDNYRTYLDDYGITEDKTQYIIYENLTYDKWGKSDKFKEYFTLFESFKEGMQSTVYSADYPYSLDKYSLPYLYIESTESLQIDEYVDLDQGESIFSFNENTYPSKGFQDGYYYKKEPNTTVLYKSDLIGTVASTRKQYPDDGIFGEYWYIYKGMENNGPYKYNWLQEVESTDDNAYPLDGINGSYWYIYKKSYEGYKYEITDKQLKGGITYNQNINPEEDYTIGNAASAELAFEYDNTLDDFDKYLELRECDYYVWQENDNAWRLIGKFWLENPTYKKNAVKAKAYDAIEHYDTYVDSFIENTTFPIKLKEFFENLCEFVGATPIVNNTLNGTFSFPDNFEAINITARQLFQYIAEVAGGFVIADTAGNITLSTYSTSGIELDNSKYVSYTKDRNVIQPVSGVTVKMNSDDLGVSVGDVEDNPYVIENNPLFYAETEASIKTAVSTLNSALGKVAYLPAQIELLQDFDIKCGDIIIVDSNTFYVMDKEMKSSGCTLTCYGNEYRSKEANSINSEIVALRGKTNELTRDIEKTQSTLTDTANGLQSQITQTASSINSRVTDEVNDLESKITQTAESITSTVTDNKNELETKIEQTASSITSQVNSQGQTITEIRQDLDGISMTYNSEEGTASITIGNITVSQLVDGKYVDKVVAGIDMTGYVTFHSLETSGATTINGDNITTGTIDADRINLKGAIAWSDLSSSCKDKIESAASGVPDYITETYIDGALIKSPTIQGGTISAGSSADGYIKMSATGMNFISNTYGSLMGFGYYSGNYNLPYILFGDGYDNFGTDRGMVKKYTSGIWIGDNDNQKSDTPGGTGIFINFVENQIYKYIDGVKTAL